MLRYTVNYSGRVQGVGFRYTCVEISRRFSVAGYVQNLPNGSVKLVAEGEKSELLTFIETITERMSRNITNEDRVTSESTNEFGDPNNPDTFTVRY
ncbi:acylphosphatase [Planctomycetota bacterium]|nr:acylphosphatase [Planctomycetota bacterium]